MNKYQMIVICPACQIKQEPIECVASQDGETTHVYCQPCFQAYMERIETETVNVD